MFLGKKRNIRLHEYISNVILNICSTKVLAVFFNLNPERRDGDDGGCRNSSHVVLFIADMLVLRPCDSDTVNVNW